MSRFRHVELQYASRLLNHGPTILITSYDAASDRRNVMAAAWSMTTISEATPLLSRWPTTSVPTAPMPMTVIFIPAP